MEIIRILISSLSMICASFAVGWIFHYLRMKADEKSDTNVLKVPKLIFWIGFCDLLICYIMIIICFTVAFDEVSAACAIGFFLMSFLGLWLILYSLNWRVEFNENSLIFRNMFRKKRKIYYSEITKLKRIKIGGYRIYFEKKSIAVDYFIKGADNLWDILKVLKIKNY